MIYLVYFSGVILVMVLAYFHNKVATEQAEKVSLMEAIIASTLSWAVPIIFILGFVIFYGTYKTWMITETKKYQTLANKFEGK